MRLTPIPTDDDIEAIKYTGDNESAIQELVGTKRCRIDVKRRVFIGNYESFRPIGIGQWAVLTATGSVTVWDDSYIVHHYEEVGE